MAYRAFAAPAKEFNDGGVDLVIEVVSRSTFRFLLIQGLDIKGSGRDGHGILLACRVPGGGDRPAARLPPLGVRTYRRGRRLSGHRLRGHRRLGRRLGG
jgi:hypothetical protein